MLLLKKIPFFLFLLVLFFCLHGSVENYGYLNLGEVLQVALAIIASIAAAYILVFFFTKDRSLSSLAVFFVSLWYLFFGAIHDWIKSSPVPEFFGYYSVLVPLLTVLTVLWIVWLKRNRHIHQKLFFYLNVLFLVFCISDAFLLFNAHARHKKNIPVPAVDFDLAKVTEKPNVYFLLFDEYAGYKSLKDSFAFSNDSLYDFLRQKEFKELPVFSNYDYTPFSMSSILNMQYVDSNYDHTLLTQPDIQARFGEIRNAAVFSIFRSMGYDIGNYSIFDIKGKPALSGSNPLFPIHSILLTHKMFHKRVMKDLGWWFLTGKLELRYIKEKFIYRNDAYNKKAEEMILQAAAKRSVTPRFSYGHFFLPHGMYFRDSTGAFNSHDQMPDLFNKSLYLSYLKYTNSVIKKLVGKIVESDPGAIIIVMSDHGFYNYNSPGDDDPYNYDNFCFVRFPGRNYQSYKDKWSTVNFFRYVFNCAYGQNLPYLKDSTIYVHE